MDFLSLLTSVPTLMQAFGGGTTAPYRKQQEENARRLNEIAAAQGDTNNPLYKKLYGGYQQQNQQNLAQVIAEAQRQNRLNTRMGRTPLFSNERGGETLFRSLMQGKQQAGAQSDQQTRQALESMARGVTGSSNAYNQLSPYTQNANAAQLSGFNLINNILRGNQTQQAAPQQQFGYQAPSVGSQGAGNYSNNNTLEELFKKLQGGSSTSFSY